MPSYLPPGAIQQLPFELLRAQRYPRDPQAMGEAAQGYLDQEPQPAFYAPQRMAFTRWKTPPYDVAWGENVAGVLTALEQEHVLLARMHQANYQPPTMTGRQAAAAMGAERLPQPSDNEDPAVAEDLYPIARNALPMGRVTMTGGELSAFIKERTDGVNRIQEDAHARRARALAEAQGQVAAVDRLLDEGRPYNDPWWSR